MQGKKEFEKFKQKMLNILDSSIRDFPSFGEYSLEENNQVFMLKFDKLNVVKLREYSLIATDGFEENIEIEYGNLAIDDLVYVIDLIEIIKNEKKINN